MTSLEIPAWLQQADLIVVKTLDQVNRMVDDIMQAPFRAYDVETTGLRVVDDEIVSMQFAASPTKAYFLPLKMRTMPNLPQHEVIYRLTPVWKAGLIGHNIGYDWKMTQRFADFEIIADTLLSAKSVPELWIDYRYSWDLKSLAEGLLELTTIEFKHLFKDRKQAKRFDLVSPEIGVPYGCQDVLLALRLHMLLRDKYGFDQTEFIPTLEHEIIKPLSRMELLGVGLDTEQVKAAEMAGEKVLAEDLNFINQLAGYEVNVNSTAEVRKLLYDTCGLTAPKKTGHGLESTNAKCLEMLRGQHLVVDTLIHYRNFYKLQTGFIQTLPDFVQSDGCIHTSYNQWGAISGRLSSNKPNLQQIPKERGRDGDELRLAIRGSFVPPSGYAGFLDIDFSQIEYRIAASLAKDKMLMDAFINGEDVHQRTAAMMYKIALESVTKHQRDRGKTLNFGAIYGISEKSIAEMWGMSEYEVRQIMRSYWAAVPKLARYLKQLIADCQRTGYAETYFGRKRPIPNIKAAFGGLRGAAEREASNSPIQGAAADVMKLALKRACKALGEFSSRAVLTVHDQLVIAHHPSDNLDDLSEAVREAMEIEIPEFVPLITEAGYGKNWNDIEKYVYPSRRPKEVAVVVAGMLDIPESPVVEFSPVESQVSTVEEQPLSTTLEEDYLKVGLPAPGPETRSALQTLDMILATHPGSTPVYFTFQEGLMQPSIYNVSVDTKLLFALKRLSFNYELGSLTKSNLRKSLVA